MLPSGRIGLPSRGEHRVAGRALEDVLHRRGERDRVAADIALHALGPAGRAGRIENVRRLVRFEPFAWHVGIEELLAQRLVRDEITRLQTLRRKLPVDQQHLRHLELRARQRFVDERRAVDHLAAARTGIGRDDEHGLGVVDARREIGRRESANTTE